MAKVNLVKLRQEADAAERTGRFDKAVEALKQVVQENPRDWNTVNRIGDLFGKLNNARAANEQYVKVARYFADDGFYLKAIAVWKKVLRNEPALLEAHVSLGELYQKQGLVAEARQTLAYVYDEYVKRNKLREAGEVLRRMAEVDPGDMKVRIRLAELYAREGDAEKGAGEYAGIAEELVKKGLLSEALQLLDKALRAGPRSARLLSAAARIHLVQKDYAAAVKLLEEARRSAPADRETALRLAEACLGARRGDDARAVLRLLLERDPADLDARQQLAHVSLVEGRHDEAFDDLQPVIDRLVERRQLDRAAALLQQIVQRNPVHVRTLAKLVELYRLSRNDQLAAQTYSLMVEAYLGSGQLEQAISILQLLVELEPTNEQHRTKLKWLHEQQAAAGGFDVDLAHAAPQPRAAPPGAPPPVATGIELTGPLSPEDQEFVSEHLAEGRVFRKYGLSDKARDQFEGVLSRFPDNVEALQELAELLRDRGDKDGALRQLQVLAQVLRLKGEASRAAEVEAQVAQLGSAAAAAAPEPVAPVRPRADDSGLMKRRAPAAAPALPPGDTTQPDPVQVAAGQPALDLEIDVEEGEDREEGVELAEIASDEPPAADVEVDFDDESEAHGDAAMPAFPFAESSRTSAAFSGGFIDDDEPAPAPPEAGFDLREDLEPQAEISPSLASMSPNQTAPPQPLLASPSAGQGTAGEVPVELRRPLEVIESYVALGFVQNAKEVLGDLPPRLASHPALRQRLAELGLAGGTGAAEEREEDGHELVALEALEEPADEEPLQLSADFLGITSPASDGLGFLGAPEPAVEPPPAAEPDLSSELGDLFGPQSAVAEEAAAISGTDFGDDSLADIFREFQKGVEKQLGKEDYETRYNLGIAYKEMGLVDEAISEFQLAAKDEARLLECASMLGICFVEKGLPKLAVKWFEKGLAAPGRSEEEYQALRYDLACALELSGESARAIALFTDLYGQDAKFRDVAEKVRRLSGR